MANPPEEPGNGVAENSDVVQQLKASNAHFRDLIEKNKALYHAIEDSQKGAGAQDPTARKKLEAERAAVLEEITQMIADAERD
jgi:uncharacterized protein YdcH (DUF465 family)